MRALEDYGCDPDLTPAQIGQTWLNYLIENRTVLWWGGLGNSTEHTAYLRLKDGVEAPRSGSMALNGKVVAEQIGAQIFIDGWAMVCPGDPERAADFARRAATVSHDGEAVYGAQILAAMEAQAFLEDDIDTLIDTGVAHVPGNSILYRMIADIRDWHAKHGDDWRATFAAIKEQYGYDRYGGNCHMVPNHGLIIHALLHGAGDFRESMKIVNTAGWDTDCNSGNLGCLLGIRGGIDGLEGNVDWRGPVADICYLPSADSGRGISDAAAEAARITAVGHRLADTPYEPTPRAARDSTSPIRDRCRASAATAAWCGRARRRTARPASPSTSTRLPTARRRAPPPGRSSSPGRPRATSSNAATDSWPVPRSIQDSRSKPPSRCGRTRKTPSRPPCASASTTPTTNWSPCARRSPRSRRARPPT